MPSSASWREVLQYLFFGGEVEFPHRFTTCYKAKVKKIFIKFLHVA